MCKGGLCKKAILRHREVKFKNPREKRKSVNFFQGKIDRLPTVEQNSEDSRRPGKPSGLSGNLNPFPGGRASSLTHHSRHLLCAARYLPHREVTSESGELTSAKPWHRTHITGDLAPYGYEIIRCTQVNETVSQTCLGGNGINLHSYSVSGKAERAISDVLRMQRVHHLHTFTPSQITKNYHAVCSSHHKMNLTESRWAGHQRLRSGVGNDAVHNGNRVSFWGERNALELERRWWLDNTVSAVEVTELLHFKTVKIINLLLCEFYHHNKWIQEQIHEIQNSSEKC